MNSVDLTALGFFIFSLVIFFVLLFALKQKQVLLKRYLRISGILYCSGTTLILLVSWIKPILSPLWMWILQILVFLIFVASSLMILFIVRKFEAGAITPETTDKDAQDEN